jgi:hypothetical protein
LIRIKNAFIFKVREIRYLICPLIITGILLILTIGSRKEDLPAPLFYSSVAAGGSHSLALTTDGSLWAWGGNGCGQLGDGTTEDNHSPVRIGF